MNLRVTPLIGGYKKFQFVYEDKDGISFRLSPEEWNVLIEHILESYASVVPKPPKVPPFSRIEIEMSDGSVQTYNNPDLEKRYGIRVERIKAADI